MNDMQWNNVWRQKIFSRVGEKWDLIIIGGGITGAGIFRSAVSAGLKTLLVEANDFAFGTSSRSSKLVHGGFRYLYNRQYHVTYESVTERQRLLREAPSLIKQLPFNLPNYASYDFPSWIFGVGLGIYDLMAGKWSHHTLSFPEMEQQIPGLTSDGFIKGFQYGDAVLDDARLVFRIIRETVQDGGTAINYARAINLLLDLRGNVCGVTLQDMASGELVEVQAGAVINAAGPWSDEVRSSLHVPARLRPLRGSHLIISGTRLPVCQAVTFFHPRDKRAMFIIPWEGTTLVGTTDIDHSGKNSQPGPEPFAAATEIEYILEGISFLFPRKAVSNQDILSTFSGLRPVIDTGAATPSKESRAHQVWIENGLVTVSGGKLTTFRIMARDILNLASQVLGKRIRIDQNIPMIKPAPAKNPNTSAVEQRLIGRSGREARDIMNDASEADLQHVSGLPMVWAELQFAAKSEAILHLDDLLLRRTRLGMLLPAGGQELLPHIRTRVQSTLGWADSRWQQEETRYSQIWNRYYSPTPGTTLKEK